MQFPTGVVAQGSTLFLAESGLDARGRPGVGRVLRVREGQTTELCGGLRAPVTGLTLHHGALYVSEGGRPGRISRIDVATGGRITLLDGLPGGGDYHTNTPMVHNGWLYFGQGAASNSGVVSWDPVTMPWINGTDLPHDLPGVEIELAADGAGRSAAFQAFGVTAPAGTRIAAHLPCTSGVMRCRLDGTGLELVAWGMRNPFGLTALPDGRILAVDLGMNDRGTRPVGQTQSVIWELTPGAWYGFPDFAAGVPVSDPQFKSQRPGGAQPKPLLANHAELGPVPQPIARFAPNSGPTQMLFDPASGGLFVALFGDKRPITGMPGAKAGRSLIRVDIQTGTLVTCAVAGLHRPIDLCWQGDDLLLLDFGAYELEPGGTLKAKGATGRLLALSRSEIDALSKPQREVAQ
ncbi:MULTISPECIES: hypothetical protein [unclassified Marinovum]